ncbi:hypothetical protein GCM10010981_09560 [Dyella nitratireducens]|uniref:Serine protease n=1 Tax=Dyella nitratireducens TaxID=1849580 RepID=A0ABQ1FQB2_9GAMM|nr:hypothetical protein GCM10010981_09560 [Dyella nitratireducens]GLQ43982.1 hypothetical protein GCM10007902_38320 [Dyella nitratireducens]
MLLSTDPKAGLFKAVGRLQAGSGNSLSTGTLIAGSASPNPNSPALILTTLHSALASDYKQWPKGAVLNKPIDGNFIPGYFKDTQPSHKPYQLDRIVYGDPNSDTAIVSLKATYGDLKRLGIEPMQLGSTKMHPGMHVEMAHVPQEGIPESERFMRYSTGVTGTAITRRKDDALFPNVGTMNLSGARRGSSGAAVIAGGKVVGVLFDGEEHLVHGVNTYFSPIDHLFPVLNVPPAVPNSREVFIAPNTGAFKYTLRQGPDAGWDIYVRKDGDVIKVDKPLWRNQGQGRENRPLAPPPPIAGYRYQGEGANSDISTLIYVPEAV